MFSISYKTSLNGEIKEEGFTTSLSPNLDDALSHFEDEVSLYNCNEIELTIKPLIL